MLRINFLHNNSGGLIKFGSVCTQKLALCLIAEFIISSKTFNSPYLLSSRILTTRERKQFRS